MKTYLDCYSCFIRQALEATRIAGKDETVQKEVLSYVMDLLKAMDMSVSPPMQAQVIHSFIREFTGLRDPYESIKKEHNSELLRLEPTFFDPPGRPDEKQTRNSKTVSGHRGSYYCFYQQGWGDRKRAADRVFCGTGCGIEKDEETD